MEVGTHAAAPIKYQAHQFPLALKLSKIRAEKCCLGHSTCFGALKELLKNVTQG